MQNFSKKIKINGLRKIYDKDGYLSPIDIITNEEANAVWHAAVIEEISSSSEYLKHIPGKRVLIQILNRLLDVNQASVKLPEGVILREFGDGAMSKLDRYSGIIGMFRKKYDEFTNPEFVDPFGMNTGGVVIA